MSSVCVIGIAGGTASGKTTLAKSLLSYLGTELACIVELDSYYCRRDGIPFEERVKINYDHPDAFEFPLLLSHVQDLRKGASVRVPIYNFAEHNRDPLETRLIQPKLVVLVEGFLTLTFEPLVELFDFTVFVDAPSEVRFERRLARDIRERGRTPESVLAQWNETVYPMHEAFCEPTKQLAQCVFDGTSFSDADVEALGERIQRLTLGLSTVV